MVKKGTEFYNCAKEHNEKIKKESPGAKKTWQKALKECGKKM